MRKQAILLCSLFFVSIGSNPCSNKKAQVKRIAKIVSEAMVFAKKGGMTENVSFFLIKKSK